MSEANGISKSEEIRVKLKRRQGLFQELFALNSTIEFLEKRRSQIASEIKSLADGHQGVDIARLDLSSRAYYGLRRNGIENVGDLIEILKEGDTAFLRIQGLGRVSLKEIKEQLKIKGYTAPLEEEANHDR